MLAGPPLRGRADAPRFMVKMGPGSKSAKLVSTDTLVEDDLEMNFIKAQSNLDRQKSNLDRKQKLLTDNIIGQKEYDQSLNEYELAELCCIKSIEL